MYYVIITSVDATFCLPPPRLTGTRLPSSRHPYQPVPTSPPHVDLPLSCPYAEKRQSLSAPYSSQHNKHAPSLDSHPTPSPRRVQTTRRI